MAKFVRIADIHELNEGTTKKFVSNGNEILLAMVNGKYYAVANKCPHLGGDLSQGRLEGHVITCPRHGSQFDVTNGNVIRWLKGSGLISSIGKVLKAPQKLKTYNVKVEGADIMVELGSEE